MLIKSLNKTYELHSDSKTLKMKQNFQQFLLICMITLTGSNLACQPVASKTSALKVIIIRHGEKPDQGDNLSCQGLNRALGLADVLYNKFKLPDFIFVPSLKTGKETGAARMYQTIVPFAVKYNLTIDTKFDTDDPQAIAAAVLKKTGTVLLVWEHKNIPLIAEQLGVKNTNLKWKGEDFDSIWIITFKNGQAVLTVDKENLKPGANCN